MTTAEKIVFLGCGNMGRAMIGGLLSAGYPARRILGVDPAAAQRQAAEALGIEARAEIAEIAEIDTSLQDCAAIVLAVKPQQAAATLRQLRCLWRGENDSSGQAAPLLLSIAAGVTSAGISAALGAGPKSACAVARAMPNTPALLRKGAAAMYANPHVSARQKQLAERIMRSIGIAVWLEREEMLDVVTAVSGCGPAYFFLLIEMLEKIARESGLDAGSARALTVQTALGAASMAAAGEHTPAALRRQVASPGGATEQALQVLMDGRLEQALTQAVTAARRRAGQLAGQLAAAAG